MWKFTGVTVGLYNDAYSIATRVQFLPPVPRRGLAPFSARPFGGKGFSVKVWVYTWEEPKEICPLLVVFGAIATIGRALRWQRKG